MLSPEQYAQAALAQGRTGTDPVVVADIYAGYSESKKHRGVVDLDDLVEICADLLENDEAFRSAQHWRYRHFFVDELQDLNPAQWRLLRGWLGDRDDLFVVGDPLQAVYSWNGADPGLLSRMSDVLPGTTVLRLDDNHRCTSAVVELGRAALGNLAGSNQIRSARDDQEGEVVINDFTDDEAEALAVARWLRERHRPGRAWSSLAVVARTNSRLDPVAEALERAGIPFQRRELAGREQEHAAIAALRAMPRSTPLRSALAELASEIDDLEWLADEVDSICAECTDADVGQLLWWRAAVAGPEGFGSARQQTDAVQLDDLPPRKGSRVDLGGPRRHRGRDGPYLSRHTACFSRRRAEALICGAHPCRARALVLLGSSQDCRLADMDLRAISLSRGHQPGGTRRTSHRSCACICAYIGASLQARTGRLSLVPVGRAWCRSAEHGQSRSTKTGAWSEGSFPLRAFRSTSTNVLRSARTFDRRMRSMRIPSCLWKQPAL